VLEGTQVAQKIRQRNLPVRMLALSSYDDERYVWGMLKAGTVGYLLKGEAPGVVGAAVRGEGYPRPTPATSGGRTMGRSIKVSTRPLAGNS